MTVVIDGKTELFGCIAHPTAHVRAPSLFNPLFAAHDQNRVMVPMDITPDGLASSVAAFKQMPNFKGAAVTIPHKMTLAELCDELGEVAQITGAVNAVTVKDGKLCGDNFDGAGFVAGVKGEGMALAGRKIALIGAGGAARAIAYALSCEDITSLTVHNRTLAKAKALQDAIMSFLPQAPLHVSDVVDYSDYDMIINATSLGLYEGDALPCALDGVREDAVICDIIMSPAETAWLQQAAARGLRCHYGRHMLDYQITLIGQFIGAIDER